MAKKPKRLRSFMRLKKNLKKDIKWALNLIILSIISFQVNKITNTRIILPVAGLEIKMPGKFKIKVEA